MTVFRKGNITNAVLTPGEVLRIREDYAAGTYTQGGLARRHGVSVGTIGRIVRGESWGAYHQPVSQSEIEHLGAQAKMTLCRNNTMTPQTAAEAAAAKEAERQFAETFFAAAPEAPEDHK